MKNTAIAGGMLAVLLLAGCSVAPAAQTSEVAPPVAVEETTAPLVAEDAAAPETGDASYLVYVRENLLASTSIPNATDDQLIAAGQQACDDIRSGVAFEDVRVVDGEQPDDMGSFRDSSAIMNGALLSYCPELL